MDVAHTLASELKPIFFRTWRGSELSETQTKDAERSIANVFSALDRQLSQTLVIERRKERFSLTWLLFSFWPALTSLSLTLHAGPKFIDSSLSHFPNQLFQTSSAITKNSFLLVRSLSQTFLTGHYKKNYQIIDATLPPCC